MAELEIAVIPLLKDNYGYLIHDAASGQTAALDPSVAPPMLEAAKERGWRISHILNTHHHWDHTDGNLGIKEATGAKVVGPAYDRERIPGIDQAVDEASGFNFAGHEADVLFIPGHTRGHSRSISPTARRCSAATPCSRSAAGAPSKARRSRCGPRSPSCA